MMKKAMIAAALAALVSASPVPAYEDRYDEGSQYTFATTRGLNRGNLHPALKVTLLPGALVLDLLFLPFALLADTVS